MSPDDDLPTEGSIDPICGMSVTPERAKARTRFGDDEILFCAVKCHDRFLAETYPGREAEVFAQLAATQPIGRMADPAEIASLAAYLCSDEAAFVTGTNHLIDGGFTGVHR